MKSDKINVRELIRSPICPHISPFLISPFEEDAKKFGVFFTFSGKKPYF
jgi:hypothetical protein